MFKQSTKDSINGWGQVFRFITPVLITLVLFILTGIKQDVGELKSHFTNHLSDHKQIELKLENRLSCIETILKK